ncbi:tRNA (guanosine(46)-N7)-methyltransferase TrmB [Oscillatoria sp. CS-180]|uniref:tRNA (guanosine(46)-N7)-methyltransferase TrmB n=1 Tax=Oscillatoria sp. CS-180 TaxID=3021720 RepID=UPI00232CC53C|nr:tRNA (guanosine(46)-N7)-methyltransferase TrmB [Oscillatoria sp. CS-180]MDB9529190.1 tRNA (guanosine(46)-N7)-methyltransferase TrmB [Oscillatoria sp. CS-180]
MAAVRVRQHVNPLSNKYQTDFSAPDWAKLYDNPNQPLHIDIGCAKGHFVTQMATLQPDWNFLGLEIRLPLVDYALQQRDQLALKNLHFLFCNANTSLADLLANLPAGALQQVSIQFPDPWFKKRHQKRRVVQPELVQSLARFLPNTGRVILQSDVEEVAQDMCDRFSENPAFQRTHPDWLPDSPFPAQTDRETLTLSKKLPVFRAIFIKPKP